MTKQTINITYKELIAFARIKELISCIERYKKEIIRITGKDPKDFINEFPDINDKGDMLPMYYLWHGIAEILGGTDWTKDIMNQIDFNLIPEKLKSK